MHPKVQKHIISPEEGIEISRGRNKNGAGAQRTLMHPEVQKASFIQRIGVKMLQEHREHP